MLPTSFGSGTQTSLTHHSGQAHCYTQKSLHTTRKGISITWICVIAFICLAVWNSNHLKYVTFHPLYIFYRFLSCAYLRVEKT